MSLLHVMAPGALSSVQDAGRFGHAALGVSASGAADPLSLAVGNRLLGNDAGCAAIEMTLVGGTFRFEADGAVAITGSDFSPVLVPRTGPERALDRFRPLRVERGDTIRFGPTRTGARCYLCVRGGIDIPEVLGSRSTHLLTKLGGHEGRALRAGDEIPIGAAPAAALRGAPADARPFEEVLGRRALRTVAGPQAERFAAAVRAAFHEAEWEVTEEADRLGLRLRGPAIPRRDTRQLLTEGVSLGAIQVPEGGQPILLFVDQQTTGGYPKIANVITADLPAVGQLRPRDRVRFPVVSIGEARAALREQQRRVDAALAGA